MLVELALIILFLMIAGPIAILLLDKQEEENEKIIDFETAKKCIKREHKKSHGKNVSWRG